MGISNQEGHLILATGNKSELAVGYSTLYGDAVGGFAPIKDVFKVDVWNLAKWRNETARKNNQTPPIPESSISKEPSAELRPGQKDSDSLPEYELLDRLLDLYVDKNGDAAALVATGFNQDLVDKVIAIVESTGGHEGLRAGQVIVRVDPRYFRPTEVETLLGDPSKAKSKLGWVPEITARQMCAEMVAYDLAQAKQHALLKQNG